MPRLLDKKVNGKYPFRYSPASSTDLAATFRRIREQQKQKPSNVQPMRRKANER